MQGRVYIIVKTEKGVKGYRNEWEYGPTPVQRLQQLYQHIERMELPKYARMFKDKEEDAERMFIATNFEMGFEQKLFSLSEDELKNPTGEYLDAADGILYIDMTEFNFRYVFVDFANYILWNANEYLLDYVMDMEDVEEEEKGAEIQMLLRSVRDITVLDKRDLRTSYPELFWEMENQERGKQIPDTKKRIQELKDEGRIEPTIGYDYFKNRFYYRSAISVDRFEDGTIEKNALSELDTKLDIYTVRQSQLLLDRDGTAWLQTTHPDLRNYTVFLLNRIEDEYAVLEMNLVSAEAH